MGLSQALVTSVAGLRAVQAGLGVVASNVANAETAGYVRKTIAPQTTPTGSVAPGAVNRALDEHLLRQLRIETAGGAYANLRAQFHDRIQLSFGEPGAPGTLEGAFNGFMAALQALATSPEAQPARLNAVGAAALLASELNRMTADIQGLRGDAEAGLAHAAVVANQAMDEVAALNRRIAGLPASDPTLAALMDQRDRAINQLAELMDIRVVAAGVNQVSVFTASGVHLAGTAAARLEFDPQGLVSATALWSPVPGESGLGTLTLRSATGDPLDLIASNSIRSGAIAAYVELRDRVLVAAQAQLDAFAAAMAQALSTEAIEGEPVSAGGFDGFEIDLDGLIAGNALRVAWLDVASGETRVATFIRIDDPGALPLSDAATADPGDRVFGLDFSDGMAGVAAQIGAALGADFTVSNPSGARIRILDDGGDDVVMQSLGASRTATGLASGLAFPLFTDGALPYGGAITASGSQMVGLAGRIAVNPAVRADPSALVRYQPATPAGDAARPDFMLARLSGTALAFPPETGIGSRASPYRASVADFLRQVIFHQGDAAANAGQLRQGQAVVVNALQHRFSDTAGVNIDQEMAHLLLLQTAYGANARVMSAVREMLDMLMRM